MKRKSFVMLIAVLVLTICLTMAFSITAFADGEVAVSAAEAPSAGETFNNGAMDVSAPASNQTEALQASDIQSDSPASNLTETTQTCDSQSEAAVNPEGVPGQELNTGDQQQNVESPEGQETDPAATEPEEEIQESVENVTIVYDYIVTISDTNGNSIDVTGGAQTAISDVLAGLGYEIGEDAIIEVDQSTVDTNVVTVSENEDGRLVLTDKGPFSKAAQNMIIYVNGVAIELELVDPTTLEGNKSAAEVQGAFYTTANENVKLTGNVTLTDDVSITLNSGVHDLYLNGFTLSGCSGATNAMFVIEAGAIINVYGGADTSVAGDGKITGVSTLFSVNGGTLNIFSGTVDTTGAGSSLGGGTYVSTIEVNSGDVNVIGGTVKGSGKQYDIGVNVTGGELNVTGGSIEANGRAVNVEGGVLNVYGGTVSSGNSKDYFAIYVKSGKANVTGGTVSGDLKATAGTLSIAGGTFSTDPSTYLCEGVGKWNVDTPTKGKYIVNAKSYSAVQIAADGTMKGKSVSSFINAFDEDGTLVMLKNIEADVTAASGKTIVLNLNGKTLTGDVTAKGKLTIKGSEGAVIGDVKSDAGDVTIESGKFNGTVSTANSGKMAITGGKFSDDPSQYLGKGYGVVDIDEDPYYYEIGEAVAYDGSKNYVTVQKAIDAQNSEATITMLKDSIENVTIAAGKVITLDLNGKTLSAIGTAIYNSGTLTVTDLTESHNGKVSAKGDTSNSNAYGIYNNYGAVVTVKNATIESGNATGYSMAIYNFGTAAIKSGAVLSANNATGSEAYGIHASAGSVTISGGEVTAAGGTSYCAPLATLGSGEITIEGDAAITLGETAAVLDKGAVLYYGGTITINGGKFVGKIPVNSGTLTINGGKFSDDPAEFITVDYAVKDIAETPYLYEVVTGAEVIANDGTRGYVTVQKAIDAQTAAATITMVQNSIENVTIAAGKVITLDLNGKMLKGDGTASIITNSGNLTLKDSNPTAERYFTYVQNGFWTIIDNPTEAQKNAADTVDAIDGSTTVVKVLGGVITGGLASFGGGVYNAGTFTMNGGTIANNIVDDSYYYVEGGGVYNAGTFTMNGGSISGNLSFYGGGGVSNHGEFTMYNGIIACNMTYYGGGVLSYTDNSKFTMAGGTISGNTALYWGGGVYTCNPFTMTGGSITGNWAEYGGGVIVYYGDCTMTGGSITGNTAAYGGGGVYQLGTMTIGGTAVIKGNTNGTDASNIYLPDSYYLTISTETPLAEGAEFWVTTGKIPTAGDSAIITGINAADYSKFFNSDNASYVVFNTVGNVVCIGTPVAQYGTDGFMFDSVQKAVNSAAASQLIVMIADSTENVTVSSDDVITLDLNGKTLTGNVTSNGKLTLKGSEGAVIGEVKSDAGDVTIESGKFNGTISTANSGKMAITGGKFSVNPTQFLTVDYAAKDITETPYLYEIVTGTEVIANDGSHGYVTVQKAIDFQTAAATITMVQNSTENVTVSSDDIITLDLNGKTLTGKGVDSDETVITVNGGSLTIKDGKVVSGTAEGIGIRAENAMINVDSCTIEGNIGISISGNNGFYSYITNSTINGTGDKGSKAYSIALDTDNIAAVKVMNSELTAGGYGIQNNGASVEVIGCSVTAEYYDEDNKVYSGQAILSAADSHGNLGSTSVEDSKLSGRDITVQVCDGSELTLKGDTELITLNGDGCTALVNDGTFKFEDTIVTHPDGEPKSRIVVDSDKAVVEGDVVAKFGNYDVGDITAGTFDHDPTMFLDTKHAAEYDAENKTWTVTTNVICVDAKHGFATVQQAVDFQTEAATITMVQDSKENVTISDDDVITLDLNSKKLTGTGSGSVITNKGTLTLTDSSAAKTGTVTGGSAMYGGGVNNDGTFTITGGIITGNRAAYGGGVYQNGTMTIGGTAVIKDNTSGLVANNIYLPIGTTVTVSTETPLAKGAEICVTTQTVPVLDSAVDVTTNGTAADRKYFHSDIGAVILYEKDSTDTKDIIRVGYPVAQIGEEDDALQYSTVQKAVLAAGTEETAIKMVSDTTEDITITAGQDIKLDLNGKFITGDISVAETGKLFIDDLSKGTKSIRKIFGGVDGKISADKGAKITIKSGLYSQKLPDEFLASGYMLYYNPDTATSDPYKYKVLAKGPNPYAVVYPDLVDTTDDDCEAVIEIIGQIAKIYVVDKNEKVVDPVNVTILEPAEIMELGAKTAKIRFTDALSVVLDIKSSMCGSEDCIITIDNVNGVIVVACDGTAIFSADLTDIIDIIAELVYDGETLKAIDADGNVIKEFEI